MRRSIFFSASLIALLLLSVLPFSAFAQSADQTLVIDDAQIFGDKIKDVEAAASQLLVRGADIRVRTILTYGSAANLDQYEERLEQRSPSWLGADGNLKNNLIVLIVSLEERQMGIYYGSSWNSLLEPNWKRIQTDIMGPRFQDGDYAGGVISGLEEILRLIQTKSPSTTTSEVQPPATSRPGGGSSNWWIIPVVIIVIIGLIIGWLLIRNYRKNQAKVATARQKALLAKQGAASGINDLIETLQLLEIKVNVTADKVVPEEGSSLKNNLEKARSLINQSSQTYSEMSHSAGDPENPGLGEVGLVALEREYRKILDDLGQAREATRGVAEEVAEIQEVSETFPDKVAGVNREIDSAVSKQEEMQRAGFKVSYSAQLLDQGRLTLEQAKVRLSQKRIKEANQLVIQAAEQVAAAIRASDELPLKKQEAELAIPALATRIEQVKVTIEKGRSIFERLFQEYAESNWASVRGNGTEAENRINWTLEALENARAAIQAQQQEYHKAIELIEKGHQWLKEAESLMDSISSLEANLIAARRDAPNEINAAQIDVAKAWEYINRYDEDIRESLEDDLRAAEKKNELAREELGKEKPDYFLANRLAREANEAADKILLQAQDEHEAAERLRAKAVSSLRDASAKVSIASKYIQDHHPVIHGEARDHLNKALVAFEQARAATDVDSQISLASQAESAADAAYSQAQKDVNNTNMNVPNILIPGIFIPPPGRTSGGSSSWGSPRTGSPGSFGRRSGGGSTSWGSRGGGGSGRGGGSSGW